MKLLIGTVAMVSGVLFAVSMASANPALLPKHEGYPMKNSGSPVNGQPTANDPGQSDARGASTLTKAAGYDDAQIYDPIETPVHGIHAFFLILREP